MWYLIPGFLQEQGSDPECMATFNRENNHNSVDLGMAYFQTNLTCSQATKLSIKKHRPTSRCCITMHNKDPWRKNNGDLHETNLVSCYPEVETTPYLHGWIPCVEHVYMRCVYGRYTNMPCRCSLAHNKSYDTISQAVGHVRWEHHQPEDSTTPDPHTSS